MFGGKIDDFLGVEIRYMGRSLRPTESFVDSRQTELASR
jgi:hypothetical protein